MTVLDKIFKDLEDKALEPEYYKYWTKQTHQIIRANIEPLEKQIKELEELLREVRKKTYEELPQDLLDRIDKH